MRCVCRTVVWISSSAYFFNLRISFGTGSPFAFPGSMIGVLLSSLFYMYRKHIFMASVGEVLGTGVIGSLMCIPLAWFMGMEDFFVKPLMIAFMVSSVMVL